MFSFYNFVVPAKNKSYSSTLNSWGTGPNTYQKIISAFQIQISPLIQTLITLLMNSQNDINTTLSSRDRIRQKLKGTLSSWKIDLSSDPKPKSVYIRDRTPVKGVTEFTFDDAFKVIHKIGEGASGTVYTCISKKDGKEYAVKISRGDEEMIRIAKKTFKILKEMNHSSIVKAKYLFLDEQHQKIYLVMDYFPFPSVASIQDSLTVEQKKNIVTKILETLIYLHDKGICHRDIKLDNILYDRESRTIRLIDFGISKKIKKQCLKENMWTITGTLKYMAPQILLGGNYNQTVDCWALGILTYFLFYSKYPFDSQYKSETIKEIIGAEPAYFPKFGLLNDFIKRLLLKNPAQRSSASQALRHPWIEGFLLQKPRLGSEDAIDVEELNCRYRNYSYYQDDSPLCAPSRQDIVTSLKELDIYQHKSIPKNVLNKSC